MATYDYLFKFLLIGDSGTGAGKTSLLERYVEDTFSSPLIPAIGIDYRIKDIGLYGKKIKLQIWDTPGQERFREITTICFRGAQGIIMGYDITYEQSFQNIRNWKHLVEEHAPADVQCLLIGNKSDSESRRKVSKERGAQLAAEFGIPFLETSAKTGHNVTEAFELLARLVLFRILWPGIHVQHDKHYFTLMLLGDKGVGKTDVLCKYTDKPAILHTEDVDIVTKSIELKKIKIELMIWEDPPLDYHHMGIVLVYDITNRKSFENITKWLKSVRNHAPQDVECLLTGNKSDLEKQRKVSKKEVIELAQQLGIPFLETSAKTNFNIDKTFEQLALKILTKKMSESERLKAFESTLEEKGSLEQTIMHCLFFGHPRGGKSSLIKRLTGHPPTHHTPSTGVMERAEVCTSTALSSHSQWSALTLDDEAIALITIASQAFLLEKTPARPSSLEYDSTVPDATPLTDFEATIDSLPTSDEAMLSTDKAGSNETTPSMSDQATPIASNAASSNVHDVDASSQLPEVYHPPIEILKKAMTKKGLKGVQQYLQDSLTLYLTDTGGQMEFQELLPALVAGPSIFFVVFRLDQDLNKTFTVEYLHPDGSSAQSYQSSFSVKETLLQSLASIASMGSYVYSKKLKKQVPLKPKVVLVGTYKDKVPQWKIAQIDRELQQLVEATSLYRDGLIEPASESQLIITVNNLSRNDLDFQFVRSVVERIAKRGDFKICSPSTWFIFALLIRQQQKRVITYDECFSIAQKCGIDSHDELNEALWFLNTKVGLVRHFRGEGLEELEEIVIIDPQILFDKITKLIVETFTFHKVTADVHKEFKRKGIFPLSVLEQLSSSDDEDQLLTVSRLIKLLEHLHIIARLHSDTEEVKYFMPCALAHAKSTAPVLDQPYSLLTFFKKLVSQDRERQQEEDKLVSAFPTIPPLLVMFKCGYCPKGLFSALSVYLLANKMKSHLSWELQTDHICKNAISLSVGPFATMTLSLTPTYMEVSVVPTNKEQNRVFPIEEMCTEVRQCIETAVQEVTSSLNYSWDAEHALAFYCPGDHEGLKDKHPAIVQYYNNKPVNIRCELTQQKLSYDLPKGYQDWFHEHSVTTEASYNTYRCPETNLEDVENTQLDSQHLLEITDYLQGLEKTDLYNLGLVLGLRRHRITDLRERCGCLEFCDCIVDCWLQRVDDVEAMNMIPSWRNLVLALKHPRVGQTGLADCVAKERPVSV